METDDKKKESSDGLEHGEDQTRPTDECLKLLEKLGAADTRLDDLTQQVEHLNDLIIDIEEPSKC